MPVPNVRELFGNEQCAGSYRVLSKLTEGGMGAVYLAEHKLLGRKAAVKVLLPRFSQDSMVARRFENEARAMVLVRHPGIVEVFEFGHLPCGSAFLVLEYLEGEALSFLMRRAGVLPTALVVEVGRQLAHALAAAHAQGIVHRDIKPDNVILVASTEMPGGLRVKLLDFGIAKLPPSKAGGVRTLVNVLMGTPSYMAPEAWYGAALVDRRADLYSLGCVLFKMVCGKPPFAGTDQRSLRSQHLQTPPPPLRVLKPGVSERLEAVILRMLEKRIDQRYQSMEELLIDLDQLGRQYPPPSKVSVGVAEAGGSLAVEPTSTLCLATTVVPIPPRAKRSKGIRYAVVAAASMICGVSSVCGLWHQLQQRAEAAPVIDASTISDGTATNLFGVAGTSTSPGPGTVRLTINSNPPGSLVFLADGKTLLGTTPLPIERERSGALVPLLVRRPGYRAVPLQVPSARDVTVLVDLLRLPRKPQRLETPSTSTAAPRPPAILIPADLRLRVDDPLD